jgi:flagellar biosynthesis chaperone FliJ
MNPFTIPKNEVINLTLSQQSFGKIIENKKEVPVDTLLLNTPLNSTNGQKESKQNIKIDTKSLQLSISNSSNPNSQLDNLSQILTNHRNKNNHLKNNMQGIRDSTQELMNS